MRGILEWWKVVNFGVGPEFSSCALRPGGLISLTLDFPTDEITVPTCRVCVNVCEVSQLMVYSKCLFPCSFTHKFDLISSYAFWLFTFFFFLRLWRFPRDPGGNHKCSWFLGFLLKPPVSERTFFCVCHLIILLGIRVTDFLFSLCVRYQNISPMTPLVIIILENLFLKLLFGKKTFSSITSLLC